MDLLAITLFLGLATGAGFTIWIEGLRHAARDQELERLRERVTKLEERLAGFLGERRRARGAGADRLRVVSQAGGAA